MVSKLAGIILMGFGILLLLAGNSYAFSLSGFGQCLVMFFLFGGLGLTIFSK